MSKIGRKYYFPAAQFDSVPQDLQIIIFYTLIYLEAKVPQIGQLSEGFPNSMLPQTGQRYISIPSRSLPFPAASKAIL